MFKYFNCFFSSFFRTLGRIIVYILLGLVFSTILSKIDVHADVKLNGSTLNYKDYIYVGEGNRTFEFNDSTLYYADQVPQNFLATFCSSDNKITSWYSNINDTEFPHELNIYKTNIPCQYSTSDYTGGTITYFYGKSFTCPASGNNPTCSSWGKWTFYSYSGSYQLLNFITTNDDISIDFSSGAVISQNQQIINQNQQIINQGQQTNDKLDDINSSINDSSSPDLDALKNTAGWLPAGPIDSILNLPLTLLNSLTTNLSKSCSPVELPLPFIDKNLTLPCLSSIYSQIDGLSVWINSISVIASAFILFQYLMNLYKWVDDTLSFRENNFIDNWTGV